MILLHFIIRSIKSRAPRVVVRTRCSGVKMKRL